MRRTLGKVKVERLRKSLMDPEVAAGVDWAAEKWSLCTLIQRNARYTRTPTLVVIYRYYDVMLLCLFAVRLSLWRQMC